MQDLLNQIKLGIKNKLYYLSLFVVLTIPDICGAIESPDGEASKSKYIKRFNENLSEYINFLDGETCYFFRCSLLHQGSSQKKQSKYKRIMFIEPGNKIRIHRSVLNDALFIDIEMFCEDLIKAHKLWLQKVSSTKIFQINIDKFIQRYPDGLSPYITGCPVIG